MAWDEKEYSAGKGSDRYIDRKGPCARGQRQWQTVSEGLCVQCRMARVCDQAADAQSRFDLLVPTLTAAEVKVD